MPRRAPRSRHRSAKLSARRLLTPQWRAWSIRLLQHPVRLLLLMDLASPLRFPRERGLRLSHPRRLRCRRSMPRLLPDDAPPERIGGLLGGKRTGEVGRRAQQAFHASAGIVKGGESFAENSDPWVASDRGRQHSYPVSRPLAHRLHSSYQAAFEAALMSCRIVGRLRWVGGRHGGCRARRATRRGRQAEPRQGPIASAHGSRCRAAGSAADACTSSTRSRHPTRAIGEVAAPVAVVAQPFGYGGERARLGRAVADAPVEHGGGIVGRDEFMQFGGPAKYARRVP